MLDTKLNTLKGVIVEYAALVEKMIDKCISGLLQKSADILMSVIVDDENRANQFELDIDELCVTMIAQYEPKAKDLRTILMVLKMNSDFERMGDHAVNIAQSAQYLITRPLVKPLVDIPRMAQETMKMLKDSTDSFIRDDASLARNVCERDNVVDALRDTILRDLIKHMISDPSTIERALHLISIARNLERIADLSTNICEDVIFMVAGRIIKHHKDEMRND